MTLDMMSQDFWPCSISMFVFIERFKSIQKTGLWGLKQLTTWLDGPHSRDLNTRPSLDKRGRRFGTLLVLEVGWASITKGCFVGS